MIVGLFSTAKWIISRHSSLHALNRAKPRPLSVVLMAMATLFGNIMTIEDVPTAPLPAPSWASKQQDRHPAAHQYPSAYCGHLHGSSGRHCHPYAHTAARCVTGVGVSPLHFGVIIVVNLAIGFITPPGGRQSVCGKRRCQGQTGKDSRYGPAHDWPHGDRAAHLHLYSRSALCLVGGK